MQPFYDSYFSLSFITEQSHYKVRYLTFFCITSIQPSTMAFKMLAPQSICLDIDFVISLLTQLAVGRKSICEMSVESNNDSLKPIQAKRRRLDSNSETTGPLSTSGCALDNILLFNTDIMIGIPFNSELANGKF